VEVPESVPPGEHEARPPQVGEMTGSSRLRNLQNVDDVTHAELTLQ
jgi:hypothetical protein